MLRTILFLYLMVSPARFFALVASQPWYRGLIRQWLLGLDPREHQVAAELGSGPGLLAEYLAGYVKSVIALDNSAQMNRFARRRRKAANLRFSRADALDTGFWGEPSFDLIVAASLLNIIGPKAELVKNAINHLNDHGVASFLFPTASMTPNSAIRLAKEQGLRGVSRELLLMWATFAPKLDPQKAKALFAEAPSGVISVTAYMGGLVASLSYKKSA